MEDRGSIQQINLEEILKAAREAASTDTEEWILRQIRGEGTGDRPSQEALNKEGDGKTTREKMEAVEEPKTWQQNANRCSKKADKKDAEEPLAAGIPAPSKRARANKRYCTRMFEVFCAITICKARGGGSSAISGDYKLDRCHKSIRGLKEKLNEETFAAPGVWRPERNGQARIEYPMCCD
ncbi:hypothetical protein NDU88_001467 [Pleurodeles waltl]|uniref:Uncharacterized protein n=1 Tax=Pleurodeles waltl TaxID=8319 RepID=A0AAV7SCS2_PLEWA|nr:hypothetical protein NDU88_001467 [Pleurodeles waltl]